MNKLFLTFLPSLLTSLAFAQPTSEVSFRITPNFTSRPYVVNPSPSKIYGQNRFTFDAGVSYLFKFNSNIGTRLGVDIGILDWNTFLFAPRNAFGIGTGEGDVDFNMNLDNYLYNSLTSSFMYAWAFSNLRFRSELGPAIRFYHRASDPDIIGAAFNRLTPYDPDNPNSGPADFLNVLEPLKNSLDINIHASFSVVRQLTKNSSITVGIRKNWNVQPVAKSEMTIIMYNQTYKGEFRPKSSFLGVDFVYNYQLK